MKIKTTSPATETELWERACRLRECTLGELALEMRIELPAHFKREKGWIGQLLEHVLGASAGSLAKPDFPHLGIELKTLALKPNGKPKESTYVSMVPLMSSASLTWSSSNVYHKLKRILWIPYFFDTAVSPYHWRFSQAILWSPSAEEEAVLKQDWQDLMSLVQLGQLDQIHARLGQYLQIRPKAMNAAIRTKGIGQDGTKIQTSPLGFYLRTSFTEKIVGAVGI